MQAAFIKTLYTTLRRLNRLDRLVLAQIVLWAAAMLSLPVINWNFGQEALRTGIQVGVLIQAAAVLAILARSWGTWLTLRVGLLVFFLSLAFEALA